MLLQITSIMSKVQEWQAESLHGSWRDDSLLSVYICLLYWLSVKLWGGLIRVSKVRGVPWQSGAGKPGIKQANMQSCSRSALLCNACIHSKNKRTPSRRIYSADEIRQVMKRIEIVTVYLQHFLFFFNEWVWQVTVEIESEQYLQRVPSV